MGPFDRKWGALPAALWLDEEVHRSPEAMRQYILAGPDGIWDLADRHLPAELRVVLREARDLATLCNTP
jgi:hypothetical protein